MNIHEITKARKKRADVLLSTRKQLGITITALSKETGLSRDTINRIEQGKTAWTIDTENIYLSGLHLSPCRN